MNAFHRRLAYSAVLVLLAVVSASAGVAAWRHFNPPPIQLSAAPPPVTPVQAEAPALKLGDRRPDFTLPDTDGKPRSVSEWDGKLLFVNFWATWCPPCVEEIPSLQRLYRQLKPRGLEILAVDVGETVETMEAFLADKPVDFPVLMDTDGDALRRWGIYAFPTTLVLDRRHRIRYAVFGAFDWSSQEVIDALAPLLEAGRQ